MKSSTIQSQDVQKVAHVVLFDSVAFSLFRIVEQLVRHVKNKHAGISNYNNLDFGVAPNYITIIFIVKSLYVQLTDVLTLYSTVFLAVNYLDLAHMAINIIMNNRCCTKRRYIFLNTFSV